MHELAFKKILHAQKKTEDESCSLKSQPKKESGSFSISVSCSVSLNYSTIPEGINNVQLSHTSSYIHIHTYIYKYRAVMGGSR